MRILGVLVFLAACSSSKPAPQKPAPQEAPGPTMEWQEETKSVEDDKPQPVACEDPAGCLPENVAAPAAPPPCEPVPCDGHQLP